MHLDKFWICVVDELCNQQSVSGSGLKIKRQASGDATLLDPFQNIWRGCHVSESRLASNLFSLLLHVLDPHSYLSLNSIVIGDKRDELESRCPRFTVTSAVEKLMSWKKCPALGGVKNQPTKTQSK